MPRFEGSAGELRGNEEAGGEGRVEHEGEEGERHGEDSLSQEAAEEEDKPNTDQEPMHFGRVPGAEVRDGAGGWYRREPIRAREEGKAHEEGQDLDDDEEGRRPKVLDGPVQVSKKMREEHEATHLPYRSWCAHCVRGRGRSNAHKARREEKEKMRLQG